MATITRATRSLVTGSDPDSVFPVPVAAQFVELPDNDPAEYLPADDLERIAALLIAKHDGTLAVAGDLRIVYRWKREGGEKSGKQILGQCVKASPLLRHLAAVDVIIWLAADHLRGAAAYTVEAALFHELLHVDVTEGGRARLAPHDYAGFRAELDEYGAWYDDLRLMADAARQLPLFGDGEG